MKFNFLFATLAAATVSALPTNSNAISISSNLPGGIVEAERNISCRITNLRWGTTGGDSANSFHTFTFEVRYLSGTANYKKSLTTWGDSNGAEIEACHDDGIWCVTFTGQDKNKKVMIKYAGESMTHQFPQWRFVSNDNNGEVAEYWDCI
ncbi:hypothetical protein BGZ95_011245 [Linnemannia exigua]|uniref:Uncharacterized protein n=1 Tax=Linnemannia exigua TaxID=604196 RepID=A0AAD4H5B4_9FUNG|nr:hypothetical protein BGZ95_011245 [Linnemannia exigua]